MNKEIKIATLFFGVLLSFYVWLGGAVYVRTMGSRKNDYIQCCI